MKEILPDVERWEEGGERVVVATVVATRRSTPRPVGSSFAISLPRRARSASWSTVGSARERVPLLVAVDAASVSRGTSPMRISESLHSAAQGACCHAAGTCLGCR